MNLLEASLSLIRIRIRTKSTAWLMSLGDDKKRGWRARATEPGFGEVNLLTSWIISLVRGSGSIPFNLRWVCKAFTSSRKASQSVRADWLLPWITAINCRASALTRVWRIRKRWKGSSPWNWWMRQKVVCKICWSDERNEFDCNGERRNVLIQLLFDNIWKIVKKKLNYNWSNKED